MASARVMPFDPPRMTTAASLRIVVPWGRTVARCSVRSAVAVALPWAASEVASARRSRPPSGSFLKTTRLMRSIYLGRRGLPTGRCRRWSRLGASRATVAADSYEPTLPPTRAKRGAKLRTVGGADGDQACIPRPSDLEEGGRGDQSRESPCRIRRTTCGRGVGRAAVPRRPEQAESRGAVLGLLGFLPDAHLSRARFTRWDRHPGL